jgi:hypothetical protein
MMLYPRLVRIRQQLDDTRIDDIDAAIQSEMEKSHLSTKIKHGTKVAITAGSRGITDIVPITASMVRKVRSWGGKPFVIPAMGSHGGATASGQLDLLEEYGMTEVNICAPIISSMEVAEIGKTESGIPVYIDQEAFNADHILVVNRIKAHTEFKGQIESGLFKMMVIGLGKHQGAIVSHQFAVKYGYERTIKEVGQFILERAPISLGIGIVENGYGQTAKITAIEPRDFFRMEKKLLEEARVKTPRLPFDEIDILIVDECGKEISGTGMDTKVVGRIMNIYELEVDEPRITRIILRDLSEKTHGNAIGVGLADFVTKRVVAKIDYRSTYINCVTAVTPEKGKLPIVCENDREALEFAMATAGPLNLDTARIVWIRNTSKLDELFISHGLLAEVRRKENLKIVEDEYEIKFDDSGHLIEFWER